MFLKIISTNVKIEGISETIYEISVKDARNYYMRKSVYDKINSGEYYLFFINGNMVVYDSKKDRKEIEKLNNYIY